MSMLSNFVDETTNAIWNKIEPQIRKEKRSAIIAERERCAKMLELSSSDILLMAGECTASELRVVKAVLRSLAARMRG